MKKIKWHLVKEWIIWQAQHQEQETPEPVVDQTQKEYAFLKCLVMIITFPIINKNNPMSKSVTNLTFPKGKDLEPSTTPMTKVSNPKSNVSFKWT